MGGKIIECFLIINIALLGYSYVVMASQEYGQKANERISRQSFQYVPRIIKTSLGSEQDDRQSKERSLGEKVFSPVETKIRTEAKKINATIFGYTSSVEETDSDPWTTASSKKVRSGIVANNCLKFGTKILIDGKEYEVQDRMNARYSCHHFDIWFNTKTEAKNWGKRFKEVKIYAK